jgi:hypothetical protein
VSSPKTDGKRWRSDLAASRYRTEAVVHVGFVLAVHWWNGKGGGHH